MGSNQSAVVCHCQTSPRAAKSRYGHSNPHAHSGDAAASVHFLLRTPVGLAGGCSGAQLAPHLALGIPCKPATALDTCVKG
jgi:hypothetical protein